MQKKIGYNDRREHIRITLKERELWENPNQDGSAKCQKISRKEKRLRDSSQATWPLTCIQHKRLLEV
jgi:hypothetical protein